MKTSIFSKLKYLPCLISLLSFTNCASSAAEFQSLTENQPTLVEIQPLDGETIQPGATIVLEFSERIDFDSLNFPAIALVYANADLAMQGETKKALDWVEDHEAELVNADYILEGEERRLTIALPQELREGIYSLVISTQLKSVNGIPFNQTPGSGPTAFIARFVYGDPAMLQQNQDSLYDTEAAIETNPSYEYGPAPIQLVINELLYDGKLSETNGESFIELFGTPSADISGYKIFLINGADGQSTQEITLPLGSLIAEDGLFVIADLKTNSTTESFVENHDALFQFDPQNGPDSVHLYDRNGDLLDVLGYGNVESMEPINGVILCEIQPAIDVAGGHSLSRVEGIDTNDNFEDFIELEIPTPGIL